MTIEQYKKINKELKEAYNKMTKEEKEKFLNEFFKQTTKTCNINIMEEK